MVRPLPPRGGADVAAEPVELVIDDDGRVTFASSRAHLVLRQGDLATTIVEHVRTAMTSRAEVTHVDNLRIRRLDGEDGRSCWLVQVLPPTAASPLTRTQRRVAERAALGMTVDEVGRELTMASHTVRSHLKEVYRRLDVGNRVELARALRDADATVWRGH